LSVVAALPRYDSKLLYTVVELTIPFPICQSRVSTPRCQYIAGKSGENGPKVFPSAAVQMMGVRPIWSEM
jgi:hypothetical protein